MVIFDCFFFVVWSILFSIINGLVVANTSNSIGIESSSMPCGAWQLVARETMDCYGRIM